MRWRRQSRSPPPAPKKFKPYASGPAPEPFPQRLAKTLPSRHNRRRIFALMYSLEVFIKRPLHLLRILFAVRPMAGRRRPERPVRASRAFDFYRNIPQPLRHTQPRLLHPTSFPQAIYILLPLTPSPPRGTLYAMVVTCLLGMRISAGPVSKRNPALSHWSSLLSQAGAGVSQLSRDCRLSQRFGPTCA